MSAMWFCVPGVKYSFWWSNKFLFLVAWSRCLHFWRETKISSRGFSRCLLSWQVLFQQRKMRISWWLLNNSEIHLCLWKVWSLVIRSQSSFYVTRARKDEKNRQNLFFLCQKRWTWYPLNNYYLMSHFNQPSIERKNCVRTTKHERLPEMCFTQHLEMKSVFTFQPIKRLVSKSVEMQSLLQCFEYSFRYQKPNIMLFGGDGNTTREYEKEKPSPFSRNFSTNHNQAHPNLNQKGLEGVQIWNLRILFLLADDLSNIIFCQTILFNFNLQSTAQI